MPFKMTDFASLGAIAGVKTVIFELQNGDIYSISLPYEWIIKRAAHNMHFAYCEV